VCRGGSLGQRFQPTGFVVFDAGRLWRRNLTPTEGPHELVQQCRDGFHGCAESHEVRGLFLYLLSERYTLGALLIRGPSEARDHTLTGADVLPRFGQQVLGVGEILAKGVMLLAGPYGGLTDLPTLRFECFLQDGFAAPGALDLLLQGLENLSDLFGLAHRLRHTGPERLDLARLRLKGSLPSRHVLTEPIDLLLVLLQRSAKAIALRREGGDATVL
jgi:hypothetical protein